VGSIRANNPPAVRLKGELVTGTSCPFVVVMEKHHTESLEPEVMAYTNRPFGSTASAVGPFPRLEVNGEPGTSVNSPVFGSILNPETFPTVATRGLSAEGFATYRNLPLVSKPNPKAPAPEKVGVFGSGVSTPLENVIR